MQAQSAASGVAPQTHEQIAIILLTNSGCSPTMVRAEGTHIGEVRDELGQWLDHGWRRRAHGSSR